LIAGSLAAASVPDEILLALSALVVALAANATPPVLFTVMAQFVFDTSPVSVGKEPQASAPVSFDAASEVIHEGLAYVPVLTMTFAATTLLSMILLPELNEARSPFVYGPVPCVKLPPVPMSELMVVPSN
jgi:hypothetical protein